MNAAGKRSQPTHRVRQDVLPWLEGADSVIYVLIGIIFLVAALGMLAYTVMSFPGNLAQQGFALATISAVNDLLLVMIIMEVLRTVLSYLDERASSLQPFCSSRPSAPRGGFWPSVHR